MFSNIQRNESMYVCMHVCMYVCTEAYCLFIQPHIGDPRETQYPMVGGPVSCSGYCGQQIVIFRSSFGPHPPNRSYFDFSPPPGGGYVAFLVEKLTEMCFGALAEKKKTGAWSGYDFWASQSASKKTQFRPEGSLPQKRTPGCQHSHKQPQINKTTTQMICKSRQISLQSARKHLF